MLTCVDDFFFLLRGGGAGLQLTRRAGSWGNEGKLGKACRVRAQQESPVLRSTHESPIHVARAEEIDVSVGRGRRLSLAPARS
jgi:hypothetical protein